MPAPPLPAPLLLALSEVVGVLDGVTTGAVLGVLAGVLLAAGVGSNAGRWEAPADEAEADPFPDGGGVGPWHGLAALRCVLSLALFLTGALVPGTGVSDAVGPDGVTVGVPVTVGVAGGVLVAGDTVGFTVALPDLVPFGLTDGTALAGVVQVALGFGLALTVVPLPWPGAPLPPPFPPPLLIRWPVPAPLPPPDPFTGVVLPVLDEPMVVIACRTPGTAAALPGEDAHRGQGHHRPQPDHARPGPVPFPAGPAGGEPQQPQDRVAGLGRQMAGVQAVALRVDPQAAREVVPGRPRPQLPADLAQAIRRRRQPSRLGVQFTPEEPGEVVVGRGH